MASPTQSSEEAPALFAAPLETPRLKLSTRVAGWVLLALVVYSLVEHWLPSPAGQVLTVLWIIVGAPLAIVAINDLGALRRDRMFAKRAEQTLDDRGTITLRIAHRELARDHVQRWRKGRSWRLAGCVLGILAGGALFEMSGRQPGTLAMSLVLGLPFLLRDAQLAMYAFAWLTRESWDPLTAGEHLALRIYAGVIGIVALSIGLGLVAAVGWVWFGDPEAAIGRKIGFTLLWGSCGLGLGSFGLTRLWQAIGQQPGSAPEILEIEQATDEEELED